MNRQEWKQVWSLARAINNQPMPTWATRTSRKPDSVDWQTSCIMHVARGQRVRQVSEIAAEILSYYEYNAPMLTRDLPDYMRKCRKMAKDYDKPTDAVRFYVSLAIRMNTRCFNAR